MKTLTDHQDKVAFALPESWTQQEEIPGRSDVFFEGSPDRGVLRVVVLDVASEDTQRTPETIRKIIGGDDYQALSSDISVRHHLRRIREHGTSGTPLHMYFWEVLIPVGASSWRLAQWSLTFIAAKEDEEAKKKISQVDSVVRSARYSRSTSRSWWRFWR